MLAQIVTSKNSDAVPLERQSKILARGGARVALSTLGDWYARAADLVEPLWRVLRDATLLRYLISLDDIRPQLFDKHGGGAKRGMGFYFCRLVAEAHGGRIDCEASSVGPRFVMR